jgi:MYXO-CTERM domain-containing protein
VGGGSPQPCTGAFECGTGEACQGGFCVPTDPAAECTTFADCPSNPNDDVPPACVNGLCTGSSVVPGACNASADCNPGFFCESGACLPIPGACEVSGDCPAGENCIAGWCGVACSDDNICGNDVCRDGRCEARCTTLSDCGAFEACVAGACAPMFATIAGPGGATDSAFVVDVDGAGSTVSGGCSVSPGETRDNTAAPLALLVLTLLVVRRRKRS